MGLLRSMFGGGKSSVSTTTTVENTVNLDNQTEVNIDVDTEGLAVSVDKMAAAIGEIAAASKTASEAQASWLGNLEEAGKAAGALLAIAGVWFLLRGKGA